MRPKTGKEKISDVPAPNAYQPEKGLKAIKHNSPAYPFGVRPHIDPIDETPGKMSYTLYIHNLCIKVLLYVLLFSALSILKKSAL